MSRRKFTADWFWAAVDRSSSCWPWMHCRTLDGYGRVRALGEERAHRVAWIVANGRGVPPGMFVLHRCDNPPCCNPDHLFLGTQLDNIVDRVVKGRSGGGANIGESNPNSKLQAAQVIEMRSLYKAGETKLQLARRFGISRPTVSLIILRRRWGHVPDTAHPQQKAA